MPNTLRLLPSLRTQKRPERDPDETPTTPALARARTVTLDDLEDAPPGPVDTDRRAREIDTILVSYLLDLDRIV
jgi:hypothetical protein